MDERAPSPVPVELPHAGPMRWVRAVSPLDSGEGAEVEAVIEADHPFVVEGELLPAAIMEWMAQTAAGASVLRAAGRGQRVMRGLLAAVPEFSVFGKVPVGSRIAIRAQRQASFGPLSRWRLEARIGGELVAEGHMVFHLVVQ